MANKYENMSVSAIAARIEQTREKIADVEDERDIWIGQSQSGQHTGSAIIQSRIKKLDAECALLRESVAEMHTALEARQERL
ncbi:MAG: hypothetical protein LBC72_03440 [Spirochaetaceae bacterium]|jgi:hypothetical protein|nr:hypothetical protein [Spirochaetaceae bacterium]